MNITDRLVALHNVGLAAMDAQDAAIRARGDLPADRDYGLTKNEIVAANVMNGLLAENDALIAENARLRTALLARGGIVGRVSVGDWVKVEYTRSKGATIEGTVTRVWDDYSQAQVNNGWCFHPHDELLEHRAALAKARAR